MAICNIDNKGYCDRHKVVHAGRLAELSQMDNEIGDKYRQLWDIMYLSTNDPVLNKTRVQEFSQDLVEFVRQGSPKVTDEQYAERLTACDSCEYVDKTLDSWQCKICGCNLKEGPILPGRARWATKDCPYPSGSKWKKVELPQVAPPANGQLRRSCCGGR